MKTEGVGFRYLLVIHKICISYTLNLLVHRHQQNIEVKKADNTLSGDD